MEIFPELMPTLLLVLPFLATLVALHFILFTPLVKYLEDRDQVAGKANAEAESYEAAIADKLVALEDQLAGARRDIGELRKAARLEAQAQEVEILAAAREAGDQKVAEAVERIQKEKKDAATTLRGTARVLSSDIAAQVLGRSTKEA